jgi:hypothetical protein
MFVLVPPKVVVEWLALLILIREIRGSNLGPYTGYTEISRYSSQSLQANARLLFLVFASNWIFCCCQAIL